MTEANDGISRRAVLTGLGAVGGGAVIAGAMAGPVGAEPGPSTGAGTRAAPPGLVEISSTPVEGVSYRFLTMFDFSPETGTREWSGNGGTFVNTTGFLWASLDLPPGAVLRDVEFYTRNSAEAAGWVRIWRSGNAFLPTTGADVTIPAAADLHATRLVIPASTNGPFPHGTKLQIGYPNTTATNLINGARVGFSPGPLETVLLPTPVRAYDSRETGGPIAPNATRTISLASQLPVGAVGALINLSITNTNGSGTLRVGKSTETPVATAIQWSRTDDKVTTSVTTKVSGGRQIAVKSVASGGPTDVVVDVIGYLV
ncbi:MAG: hypothetical protein JWM47_2772 [Acidimicrobiales bacterium]|nr:hypothetical protein [Acidimicrobiales bacterium]